MSHCDDLSRHLPLSEATYYILLMLAQPNHGYGIMQGIEAMTAGAVTVGPGTVYGALQTLEKDGLVRIVREESRRRVYALTARGQAVLKLQWERLQRMVNDGQQVLGGEVG